MKKFSQHIKESSNIESNGEFYDPIYEGIITDFFRAAKDKMFSKTHYIERDQADYIKKQFTVTLISTLDSLKFKKISLTNLILNPSNVLNSAQHIFSDPRMIKEISGYDEDKDELDIRGKFRQEPNTVVPLIDEVLQITKDIERRLKKYAKDYIERRYSTNPLAKNPGVNKRIQDAFLAEFNKIFTPTSKKIKLFGGDGTEGKETGTIEGSSRFEILAYKVIRALKRNLSYDIENTHIVPKDYDIVTGYTIHGMDKGASFDRKRHNISRESILELMKKNNIGMSVVNKVLKYLEREYGYVQSDKTLKLYQEIFIEAYTRLYVETGKTSFQQYIIGDKMVEIIEESDLKSELDTRDSIAQEEFFKDEEEKELDKEMEKDIEDEEDEEETTKPSKPASTETIDDDVAKAKAKSGRGKPVEVVGNLES